MQNYNRRRLITKTCIVCGMSFSPISPMQKCCSKEDCKLAYRRTYQKRLRRLNPERDKAIKDRWITNHPIEYKAGKLRESLIVSTGEKFPRAFFEAMITSNLPGKCPYCGAPFYLKGKKSNMGLDHKIPVSRGGDNSEDNLQFTCLKCNLIKASLTDTEFRALLEFLKNYPDMKAIIKARMGIAGKAYRAFNR